jgi:hypothetical protein
VSARCSSAQSCVGKKLADMGKKCPLDTPPIRFCLSLPRRTPLESHPLTCHRRVEVADVCEAVRLLEAATLRAAIDPTTGQ